MDDLLYLAIGVGLFVVSALIVGRGRDAAPSEKGRP
jgi:hypothetical protein